MGRARVAHVAVSYASSIPAANQAAAPCWQALFHSCSSVLPPAAPTQSQGSQQQQQQQQQQQHGSNPRPLTAHPQQQLAHSQQWQQHAPGRRCWRPQPCPPLLQPSSRGFCQGELRVVHAEISEHEYHQLADAALDFLQERLEVFVEDMDVEGGDVEHAQGVLTVKLGPKGTYVINKQAPNRQLWLSSPVSGPFRYDYHEGAWVYHRDGRELLSQLEQELGQLLGASPHLVEGQ